MPTRLSAILSLSGRVDSLLNLVYDQFRAARGLTPVDVAPVDENLFWNDALGWAAGIANIPVADYTAITNDDLATAPAAAYYRMLDLGEYRLISTALNQWVLPNETVKDRQQDWGDLYEVYVDRLAALKAGLRLDEEEEAASARPLVGRRLRVRRRVLRQYGC